MSEEIKVVEVEKKVSWYNNAEGFDKWRVKNKQWLRLD